MNKENRQKRKKSLDLNNFQSNPIIVDSNEEDLLYQTVLSKNFLASHSDSSSAVSVFENKETYVKEMTQNIMFEIKASLEKGIESSKREPRNKMICAKVKKEKIGFFYFTILSSDTQLIEKDVIQVTLENSKTQFNAIIVDTQFNSKIQCLKSELTNELLLECENKEITFLYKVIANLVTYIRELKATSSFSNSLFEWI